jgi:hypothetical protein
MSKHFQKTQERKSILWRNSSYRSNCSAGFCSGKWQAHHIACNHAVEGREIDKEYVDYVEDCLWITDWDLNASPNMIGLPVNRQYRKSDGQEPRNYCSHQVDHNTAGGYTDECKKWLKKNLWDTLKDKRKKHEVTAKTIKATLEKCTSTFKAKLTSRGSRKGGTKKCWESRFKPSYENKWYFPFSMGKKPTKRHPGVNPNRMTYIFSQIG